MTHPHSVAEVRHAMARLKPDLAARAAEGDAARHLPRDLAQQMAEAGLCRLVTPRSLGGIEATASDFVSLIEDLARENASAAWCAMIANTAAMHAAYLAPETANEIFSDPLVITGGVFAPMGKAVDEGDQYRVSGRWQWGSGAANCTWLSGGCIIQKDGETQTLPNGAPDARMMIFPVEQVTFHDTWHVMGLKGTGSGDFSVEDIIVPKARSVSIATDTPVEPGALYKFPPFGLLALGVCAVALGNARGALDAFKDLMLAKRPQGGQRTLAERDTIQAAFARQEANWRAAHRFLYAEINRVWAIAENGEGQIPLEVRADLRLACTHATQISAEVCRVAYDLGGGAALFENSELQRRFRDAYAATQHIVTASPTYEMSGRVLFGLPVSGAMI